MARVKKDNEPYPRIWMDNLQCKGTDSLHTASLNWQQRIRREEKASSKSTHNVFNALASDEEAPFQ